MSAVFASAPTAEAVPVADLGERLATVRLLPPRDLDMAASLRRFGQLSPVVVFRTGDGLEVIDGFRRRRAAAAQGYPDRLLVRRLDLDERAALAALFALHRGSSRLCELEEGWVVQALIRQHRLAQAQVAQLLRRHQSWVSRRLLLVEALAPEVQQDVRLGLCSATAAREVARLPRGIQRAAAAAIEAHGLSSRQVAQLCATLERLGIRDAAEIERLASAVPPSRPPRTDADRVQADLGLVEQLALRLHASLRRRPALVADPAIQRRFAAVRSALATLTTLLDTLCQTNEEDAA